MSNFSDRFASNPQEFGITCHLFVLTLFGMTLRKIEKWLSSLIKMSVLFLISFLYLFYYILYTKIILFIARENGSFRSTYFIQRISWIIDGMCCYLVELSTFKIPPSWVSEVWKLLCILWCLKDCCPSDNNNCSHHDSYAGWLSVVSISFSCCTPLPHMSFSESSYRYMTRIHIFYNII